MKKKVRNTSKNKSERRRSMFWYTDEVEEFFLLDEFEKESEDEVETEESEDKVEKEESEDKVEKEEPERDEFGFEFYNLAFLGLHVAPRTTDHDNDASSCGYSYDWCNENRRYLRRHYDAGCPSFGDGYFDINSYGLETEFADRDLRALDQLQAAISSQLVYPPYRIELQQKFNAAFEFKEQLDDMFGDDIQFKTDNGGGYNDEDSIPELDTEERKVKASVEQCEAMIKSIKAALDQYRKNEANASEVLPFIAYSVYRSHLQQLAIQETFSSLDKDMVGDFMVGKYGRHFAGWKHLKGSVPARVVPAVGVVMQCAVPFLLGGGEKN